MNYYERHLGDYARDAGHLTMLEHGAYTLLLDRIYATEQPIESREHAYRYCRAATEDDKRAVDYILREFFSTDGEAFMNERAGEEIDKAQKRIEAARENGKLGGRPVKNPRKTQRVTHAEPNGLPVGSPDLTQAKALQTPDTITPPSEELRARARVPSRPDDVSEQVWKDWLELRKRKRAPVTETVLTEARSEAAKAQMPLDRFFAVWCNRGSQGLQAEWLRPDERSTGETAYQRNQRERVAEMSGGLVSSKPPGAIARPLVEVIHDSPFAIGKR